MPRSTENDDWETPSWLFDELHREFHFDVDLCASQQNRKVYSFWSEDYLNDQYLAWFDGPYEADKDLLVKSNCAFMNPPYSNSLPFIEKALRDSVYCKIVCLIKCDTSTKVWHEIWDYTAQSPKNGVSIRFFKRRIKFERGGLTPKNGPTFPCCLVIMDIS